MVQIVSLMDNPWGWIIWIIHPKGHQHKAWPKRLLNPNLSMLGKLMFNCFHVNGCHVVVFHVGKANMPKTAWIDVFLPFLWKKQQILFRLISYSFDFTWYYAFSSYVNSILSPVEYSLSNVDLINNSCFVKYNIDLPLFGRLWIKDDVQFIENSPFRQKIGACR